MNLAATHPQYDARKTQWVEMRDFYAGEAAVKAKTQEYLFATAGMVADGMNKPTDVGTRAYKAYLARAVFPDYVTEGVEAYVGTLHAKPATIELPEVMEPLRLKATTYGETLDQLLRRINEEQLVTGRVGILLDLPKSPDPAKPLPYIALYIAEAIRNWDDGVIDGGTSRLNLVVLDESGFQRGNDLAWSVVTQYRILTLGNTTVNEEAGVKVTYKQGLFSSASGTPAFDETQMMEPSIRGTTLDEIPFEFINTKDIVPATDRPPLSGLGKLCLTIYRGEADYRQNLFMQGQDTFVTIGGFAKTSSDPNALTDDAPVRTGAGAMVSMEAGGDAKYVGVESSGLTEQREALENDRNRAEARSGQLAVNGSDVESGEALKTRVAAQKATLNQIAVTGAAALESLLKKCAKWMGANPDQVKVTPNLEFADIIMTGQNLVDLTTARTMGAPLSNQSIHALMVDQGLTKMDYKSEMELIEEEDADMISRGVKKDLTEEPPPAKTPVK